MRSAFAGGPVVRDRMCSSSLPVIGPDDTETSKIMKAKLEFCLRWLREGAVRVVRSYPVETALAIYACAGCLMTYELGWGDKALEKLALVPLFFALALAVNNLAGRGPWRKVYWVCWTPIVPLSFWGGLGSWVGSEPYLISLGILAPLALMVSFRAVRNDRFIGDVIVWLRSAGLALLFVNVALGLFYAILYSTTYIFGLEGGWIEHVTVWAVVLAETLAVPVLFLMAADRWRGADWHANRIVEVLLNWIVTPALLIYTAILYLYMAKILVVWSLPEGGVAYLVFGFTLTALVVRALQGLHEKRIYDWFFNRFSFVSLPMLVLFWIGVIRRTNEYGMTAPRVYLVVCGALMTLCAVLFLSRRTGRYLWVCLAGLVCFAALAYVPGLEPERVALRSQMRRAVRVAGELGRLDPNGKLLLTPLPLADTVFKKEYRSLYESLEYVRRDSASFALFGVEDLDGFEAVFPKRMLCYVKWGSNWLPGDDRTIDLELPKNASAETVTGYSRFYANLDCRSESGYEFAADTLRLWLGEKWPVLEISGPEVLKAQLEKSKFVPAHDAFPTDGQVLQLLDYRSDRVRILFDGMQLVRQDSTVELTDLRVNCVWVR